MSAANTAFIDCALRFIYVFIYQFLRNFEYIHHVLHYFWPSLDTKMIVTPMNITHEINKVPFHHSTQT